MTFHWRQAVTSAVVGSLAALLVTVLVHGAPDRERLTFIIALGLAVGGSRLIDLR